MHRSGVQLVAIDLRAGNGVRVTTGVQGAVTWVGNHLQKPWRSIEPGETFLRCAILGLNCMNQMNQFMRRH